MANQTRDPILEAQENPKSRSAAIKAMCAHCMGCTLGDQEPGYTRSISDCTAQACPLYTLRPYSPEKTAKEALRQLQYKDKDHES